MSILMLKPMVLSFRLLLFLLLFLLLVRSWILVIPIFRRLFVVLLALLGMMSSILVRCGVRLLSRLKIFIIVGVIVLTPVLVSEVGFFCRCLCNLLIYSSLPQLIDIQLVTMLSFIFFVGKDEMKRLVAFAPPAYPLDIVL